MIESLSVTCLQLGERNPTPYESLDSLDPYIESSGGGPGAVV